MANEKQISTAAAGAAGPARPARIAVRRRWRIWRERGMEVLIKLCGVSSIVFVFAIFCFVYSESLPALWTIDYAVFFSSMEWRPNEQGTGVYGALALVVGTLSVTLVAMLLAVPFGLGSAVLLSEFCPPRMKEVLKVVIELLAAIPSVVWGFLGLTLLNHILIEYGGARVGTNLLNAGLILALMALPIIVSIAEDALKAVPDSFREAAEALGATRWQVVYRVLFPAAKSGLLAAVLLGVGRAVGETMAVLMCSGHSLRNPFSAELPYFDPFTPVRTLTATIAGELGEAVKGGEHWQILFVLGLLLFAITFVINLGADLIVRGIRKE